MSIRKISLLVAVSIYGFTAHARSVEKLTKIPFLSEIYCNEREPCFRITPDSKGIALISPQKHLIYHESNSQKRFKIAEVACSSKSCFDISQDSQWAGFTQIEGDEVALYVRSLQRLILGQASPAQKLGFLPRFARLNGALHHELNFCKTNETLYIKSGGFESGEVWAYQFDGQNWSPRKVFNEYGAKVTALKCGKEGEGAYISTQTPQDDKRLQLEEIHFAPSLSYLRSHTDEKGTSTLYSENSALGDSLVSDFAPVFKQLLIALRGPQWMENAASSLISFNGKNEERVLNYASHKNFRILDSNQEHAIVESVPLYGDIQSQLLSVSLKTGETVQLNQGQTKIQSGILNGVVSTSSEKVLFFESDESAQRLILTRMGGAQRQVLYSHELFNPLVDDMGPDRHSWRYQPEKVVSLAKVSTSGHCVLAKKEASTKHKGQRLEIVDAQSESKSDIFPLPSDENPIWEKNSRIGVFQLAPDSSFAVVLADLEGNSRFDLYRLPLVECR